MGENKLPRVRQDIQMFPATLREQRVFVVSDPLGLSPEPTIIPEGNAGLLVLFDGENTVRDLQMSMMALRGNVLVMEEEVKRFIDELDTYFLLETERYREAREKVFENFASLKVRPPHHAGKSYPAEKEELLGFLEDLFSSAGEMPSVESENILALVVPHIDLKIGRRAYGRGYSCIRESEFDSVLLLCTGHYLGEYYFSLTEKDYDTPLGPVRADADSVRYLRKGKGTGISPFDFPHQMEHSAEFQALILKYMFPEKDFRVVPVLCGSFNRILQIATKPSEVPGIRLFVERLYKMLTEDDRRWMVIAGVDFSHVGPKFGHDGPAKFMDHQFREHDRILLDNVMYGNPEGFFAEVKKVNDRYNVCGASPLSVLLELFEGKKGEVLDYDVWYDQPTMSAVSFASAVIYDR